MDRWSSMPRRFALMVSLCLAILSIAYRVNGAVTTEVIDYHGWAGAYRISNGTMEVVVVPATGRIMHYGYVGGRNLLWENNDLSGKAASSQPSTWSNFGGDKVFPWPQSDWTTRFGRDWPPPRGFDPLTYHVEVLPDGALHAVSPVIDAYGLRVVRHIQLADSGTQLKTITRFEQIHAGTSTVPLAVWTVTQWPMPDFILARRGGSDWTKAKALFGSFKSIVPIGANWTAVEPSEKEAGKIGLDADELVERIGNVVVVQRTFGNRMSGQWKPGERAQVYCDSKPVENKSYVELEFTSPEKVLENGQSLELRVDWSAQPVTPTEHGPAQLVKLLDGLQE